MSTSRCFNILGEKYEIRMSADTGYYYLQSVSGEPFSGWGKLGIRDAQEFLASKGVEVVFSDRQSPWCENYADAHLAGAELESLYLSQVELSREIIHEVIRDERVYHIADFEVVVSPSPVEAGRYYPRRTRISQSWRDQSWRDVFKELGFTQPRKALAVLSPDCQWCDDRSTFAGGADGVHRVLSILEFISKGASHGDK